MKKKCGGLFKEFVKAIVKHTIVFMYIYEDETASNLSKLS